MDIDTILLDTEDRMEKAMAALERDFQKLRTGRATTALVDGIKADYYGTPTPISQMASVAVPDSRTITIQPWDKGGISVVEKAILKSDLGLTPVNDGRIIRINIPENKLDVLVSDEELADELEVFAISDGRYFVVEA